ncbi:unnamed protein product [Owenia fusiformis]|uniref:Uncharacterized protein n=1 Tax=Owenia fusiformis TaxID=6347 RepID=A0A8J1UGN0_OWEFU|nr:unnamed protein product [Owenia fusiformis]
MNPGNFPPNPYGNGAGGPPITYSNAPVMYSGNYRSQRPRFDTSSGGGGPRFQQNDQGFRSPQAYKNNGNNGRQGFIPLGRSPRPFSPGNYNSPGASPRHSSPYHQNSPQWKSCPMGRGGHNNFGANKDCNPGGSDDIREYYHPSMTQDPWITCRPVPVKHKPGTTI